MAGLHEQEPAALLVLAPHDEAGYGRTKVRIEFDTLALQPRDFTIRVLPKE